MKPLFEGETLAEQLKTIDENLASIGGRMYGSNEQRISDQLELMQQAVKIDDPDQRNEFVHLVSNWAYVKNISIGAYDDIKKVRNQLQSIMKEAAKDATKKP